MWRTLLLFIIIVTWYDITGDYIYYFLFPHQSAARFSILNQYLQKKQRQVSMRGTAGENASTKCYMWKNGSPDRWKEGEEVKMMCVS